MFGRPGRMMRRGLMGGGGRGVQMARQVQALMAQGKFAEAGKLCLQFSDQAAQGGFIRPAVNMALLGTRAFIQGQLPDDALNAARRALDLIMNAGQPQRATPAMPTIIAALRANGFAAQAAALEKEAADRLAKVNLKLGQPFGQGPAGPGSIPASCPNCGGALRSDSAEWIDATSVECPWCGSTVKTS
jgi:hypothetical protein